MKKINIFLSSAMNGELDDERKSITQLFNSDAILKNFYNFFAIEKSASPYPIEKAYLDEVSRSDILVCLFKNSLRIPVKKEYEKARVEGKKVFSYIYQDASNRADELTDFIKTELFKYDPGFFDSTFCILESVKQDIHNDLVNTYQASIGNKQNDVLRLEMYRSKSLYRYFSDDEIENNKEKYQNLSADQFVILAEEIRIKTGNFFNSLLITEIGISIYPNNWHLLNNRGIILSEMGLKDHSFYSYHEALQINNNDESILYNIGNYFFDKKDYLTSINYYKKAIESNPQKTNALNKISLAYRYLNQSQNFLTYSERAYHLEKNEMYLLNYIIALADCGQIDDAKKILEDEIGKESKRYVNILAYIFWKSNETEKVISLLGYGEIVDNWEIGLYLFESYLKTNELNNAVKSIHTMTEKLNFQPEDYNNFGFILQRYDFIDLSNEYLQKAIDYNPSLLEPRITLISNYAKSKNYDKALELCNQSLEMFPFEPKLIRNKYLIYYYQNDLKTGMKFLFDKTFSVTGLTDEMPDGFMDQILKSF